jgi:hypothetical protein
MAFHGFKFSAKPQAPTKLKITDYIEILNEVRARARAANASIDAASLDVKPMIAWSTAAKEHSFERYVPKRGVEWVFYPTLASLLHRIDLAARRGLGGTAVADVGAGAAYFAGVFAPRDKKNRQSKLSPKKGA